MQKESAVLKHSEGDLKQQLSTAVVDAQKNAQEWSAAQQKLEGLFRTKAIFNHLVHMRRFTNNIIELGCVLVNCVYVCVGGCGGVGVS